jgi:GNAT superfamily N-acetyltransferase
MSLKGNVLKPPSEVKIDFATLEDLPELVRLLQTLFEQEVEFQPQPERQNSALELILSSKDRGRIFAARFGDKLVGMVSLLETVSTAEGGLAVWLEDLVVEPNFRGRKIGTALVRAALDYCKSRGIKRVTLLTDRDNSQAHRFYFRFGFFASTMIPLRSYIS